MTAERMAEAGPGQFKQDDANLLHKHIEVANGPASL